MQNQERELITGLFDRLQPFEAQPRDAEAEVLIRDLAARQPASSYLLVQTVLVQEHALKAAQERIAELEAKVAAAPAAAAGGGFLGSAPKIGPWGAAPSASPPAQPSAAQSPAPQSPAPQSPAPQSQGLRPSVPSSVPSTRSPLQAAVSQPPAGGGFLRTAMATAAGVAGGALLFEGIRNLMGGSSNPFSQGGGSQQAAVPQAPAELTPPDTLQSPPQDQQNQDQTYQDQAYDQSSDSGNDYDTASYDDGGGDDDSWA